MLDGLLVAFGAGYLGAAAWLGAGIRRSAVRSAGAAAPAPAVSVVVAARDEEAHLGACLESLRHQDYGGDLEIVVVDDGSADRTGQVAAEIAAGAGAPIVALRAPDPPRYRCRKKSALAAGIAACHGELLLFTDADCRVPPAWVRSTVAAFGEGVGLVAGYARPRFERGLRYRLLGLDNLAVAALGAGSSGMGFPLSCTGRSFAYRRAVYDEVGGFESIGHLVGGDDVYFARLAVDRTRWRMAYNLAPEAAVESDPGPRTWWGLVHQKLRHASKVGHFQGGARALGGAAYLYYAFLLLGPVKAAVSGHSPAVWAGVWLSKWVADAFLLWYMGRQVCERPSLGYVPLLEACHIPYVLVFTVLGRFGWFRWKGDRPARSGPDRPPPS
ncbi:MAG: glycosyltransferase [Gemmatimonadota bacterium]